MPLGRSTKLFSHYANDALQCMQYGESKQQQHTHTCMLACSHLCLHKHTRMHARTHARTHSLTHTHTVSSVDLKRGKPGICATTFKLLSYLYKLCTCNVIFSQRLYFVLFYIVYNMFDLSRSFTTIIF